MDSLPKVDVCLFYNVLIQPPPCPFCVYLRGLPPVPPEFLSELNEAE